MERRKPIRPIRVARDVLKRYTQAQPDAATVEYVGRNPNTGVKRYVIR